MIYRYLILVISLAMLGCSPARPSKEEIESAKTAALIMGTTCLRSNVQQRTGGWDNDADRVYRDSLAKIDGVLARMTANSWAFCRDELVEMRAITSRGRATTEADVNRVRHLEQVVNARAQLH